MPENNIHLLADHQKPDPQELANADFAAKLPHLEVYYGHLAKLRWSVYQAHLKQGFSSEDSFFFTAIITQDGAEAMTCYEPPDQPTG
jgi:hypothetical protein